MRRRFRRSSAWTLILGLALGLQAPGSSAAPAGDIPGVPYIGARGIPETVSQIMARQRLADLGPAKPQRIMPEHDVDRAGLPQDPAAPTAPSWPPRLPGQPRIAASSSPQTPGLGFTGATLADTGAFPPDSMGTIGPTQFVVFVNGRLRTFNKTTGVGRRRDQRRPGRVLRVGHDARDAPRRADFHERSAGAVRPPVGTLVPFDHRRPLHRRELLHDGCQPLAAGRERRRQRGHDQRIDSLDLLFLHGRCHQLPRLSLARRRCQRPLHRRKHVHRGRLLRGNKRLRRAKELGAGRRPDFHDDVRKPGHGQPRRGRSRRGVSTTTTRRRTRATSSASASSPSAGWTSAA